MNDAAHAPAGLETTPPTAIGTAACQRTVLFRDVDASSVPALDVAATASIATQTAACGERPAAYTNKGTASALAPLPVMASDIPTTTPTVGITVTDDGFTSPFTNPTPCATRDTRYNHREFSGATRGSGALRIRQSPTVIKRGIMLKVEGYSPVVAFKSVP